MAAYIPILIGNIRSFSPSRKRNQNSKKSNKRIHEQNHPCPCKCTPSFSSGSRIFMFTRVMIK